MRHTRCIRWAVTGVVLGLAFVGAGDGWSQEVAAPGPVGALPAEVDALLRLLGVGGLPAVVGWLAWTLARMGPLTVRIVHGDGSAPVMVHVDKPVTVKSEPVKPQE